jgi:HPt (histidine-containing phosphotransfer) domain-containing protein
VGAAAFAGVCEVFLSSVPERIAELTVAAASGDHASASRLAHNLRGTAATFHADRLSALAEQVEQICQHGGGPLGMLTDQLDDEFSRVSAAMDALVGH